MFVERLVLWITWGKVCIREEFWNVYLLMTEFDCPEMTLCGWQDVQIQLLTNWLCTGFCGYDWERHDATFWKCPLHSCKLTVWLISVTVTGVLLSEESCIIDQLVSLICMTGTDVMPLSEEPCEQLVSLICMTGTDVMLLSEASCEQLVSLICMTGTDVKLLAEASCEQLVSLICMTGTDVMLLSEASCEQLVSLICMTWTDVKLLAEASHAATFGCRQANFVPVTYPPMKPSRTFLQSSI